MTDKIFYTVFDKVYYPMDKRVINTYEHIIYKKPNNMLISLYKIYTGPYLEVSKTIEQSFTKKIGEPRKNISERMVDFNVIEKEFNY